jgi:hypothetical protein
MRTIQSKGLPARLGASLIAFSFAIIAPGAMTAASTPSKLARSWTKAAPPSRVVTKTALPNLTPKAINHAPGSHAISTKPGTLKSLPGMAPAGTVGRLGRSSESAGGKSVTFQTKTRFVKPRRDYPNGQKPREYVQQNSKTVSGPNKGEHRFYDPSVRPAPKEGVAFAKSPRKPRK